MYALIFIFSAVSVIALGILLWFQTKPGKKWLKEL